MIIRAGLAATHLIMFTDGFPDGDVTWSVLDNDGIELENGTITPAAEAVSTLIPIAATSTAVPIGEYQTSIDVVWSYTVSGAVVNNEFRYTIEKRLPHGLSTDGVRRKLGVSLHELPEGEIAMVEAYLGFINTVGQAAFDTAVADAYAELRVRNAIEAAAALQLIPTMPVRIANAESSGTNEFKRQTVEWREIAAHLTGLVSEGYLAVDPDFDVTTDYGDIFVLAGPAADPFTGETN